jgi:predicted esterase
VQKVKTKNYKKKMKSNGVFYFLLFLIFIFLLKKFLVKFIEKKLLYHPITCENYNLIVKPHSLLLQKHIFFEKKNKNKKKLIVFCHGNSGNLNMYSHFINRLAQEEFIDILCPEYPEFGIIVDKEKERSLNRHNCVQNVLDAYFAVQDHKRKEDGLNYENVFFFGFSLGTSIATQCVRLLEKDTSIKGLVLINGFSSYKNLMHDILGSFYANLLPLSFEDYNTKKYAEELVLLKSKDFKVCLVHTMKDSLIPWKHSKTLFDSFEGVHRKHILIRHGDHNLGPVQFFEEWYPSTALFLFSNLF